MNKPNTKTRDVVGILHFLSTQQMAEEIVRLDRQIEGMQHPQASEPAPSTAGERERFEAHIAKNCGDLSTFGSGQNMHYCNSGVNHEWIGWKTRAALLQTDAQPAGELTDEQIDAAVEAWFGAEVKAKGFKTRMRLAIAAAHKIGGQG